ncbi:two-component system, chemotaxis family, response regulator WspR [Gammaproteobacteria bacterium]
MTGTPTEESLPLILIVDDAPVNIKMLADTLKGDYRIKVATSGATALKLISGKEKPDLVLLDVMMPQMDGYTVCAKIKENPDTRDISVIFVTAKTDVPDQELGFNLGAVDYITKPFGLPIVRARVRTHINLKRRTALLEELVSLDSLTGIHNRRRFDEMFAEEWRRAIRNDLLISLLMLDIDHFKAFNDNYGHGAGDECLRKVASNLRTALVRPGDLVARIGGEEFVVLLPNCDSEGACHVGEKIRSATEELRIPHEFSSTSKWVTLSVGCTTLLPNLEMGSKTLMEAADKALYLAKSQGRNRISVAK